MGSLDSDSAGWEPIKPERDQERSELQVWVGVAAER